MGPNAFSADDIAQFHSNYSTAQAAKPQAQQQQQKKGPGGIAGFLINSLPAITSGVGAVGGSFLAPVAGTVAGGAAGGALGEALKRKILGEKEDVGQIATQGVEGGVLSGFGAGARGVKAGAQALTKLGTGTAEKEAAQVTTKTGGSFLKNLITQGQQAQGRVTGLSAGSKAAGKELTPQDTQAMLGTLKNEGIQTGNANNTLRDVTDKLKGYGQQISDHFKANNAPLHPGDTKVLADNYIKSLNTTDPEVLKQAQIVANDLQKNVTDTKSLWEFRKSLDSRIPDAKMAAGDNVLSNKLTAVKSARQFITKELGDVPGASNYHDLSEIKPFISAEAKRLNNPSGGLLGRLASSGPVQKAESAIGKGTENLAQRITGKGGESQVAEHVPAVTEEPRVTPTVTPSTPTDSGAPGVSQTAIDKVKETYGLNKHFAPSEPTNPAQKIAGGSEPPLPPTGGIPEADLQAASNAAGSITPTPEPAPSPSILQKFVGAAANPIANPGQTAGAVAKQELPRLPGAVGQTAGSPQQGQPAASPDTSSSMLQASANSPAASNNPYAPENAEANVQAILQQGGTDKDVAAYLSNVKAYQALQPSGGTGATKPTAQQYGLAQSGVQSLNQLSALIKSDPSILEKNATPGQGLPLVGSLVSNSAGAANYHSLADNILSSLIHLQTGATATPEEVTAAHGQLPQPGDSQATRDRKLQTLLGNFAPFVGGQ